MPNRILTNAEVDKELSMIKGMTHHHETGEHISKKITKLKPLHMGHLHVDFEDGTTQVLHRGNHEKLGLKEGDYYPALPEASSAEVSES